MVLKTGRFTSTGRILLGIGLVLLFGLALALRISLYHIETSDYTVFLSQWYSFIQTHGGLAALKDDFSNYNTPYLTLLALTTYLPIPQLIAIKTLSVVFDGVLGLFVYLILRLRYGRSIAAIAGALIVLFAPTIFINSAAWGQCDALYTAFCLGSLYFLLKERPGWACVFFALALSFKLQAIFFAPVLFVLLLKKKLPLRYLVLIPLVFLLMLTPALIAGRSVPSLLSIYAGQISSGGVGGGTTAGGNGAGLFGSATGTGSTAHFQGPQGTQSNNNNSISGNTGQANGGAPGGSGAFGSGPGGTGQANGNSNGAGRSGRFGGAGPGGTALTSSSLTLNAPSFYQWLPASAPTAYWKWIGIVLAGLFILAIGILLLLNRQQITRDTLVKVTLLFALAVPFLLPEMHERYFYLADVTSILYVFFFPRAFYIAIVMQICSLLSYAPYFQNRQIVPLSYVAGAILIVILIVLFDLLRTVYGKAKEEPKQG